MIMIILQPVSTTIGGVSTNDADLSQVDTQCCTTILMRW